MSKSELLLMEAKVKMRVNLSSPSKCQKDSFWILDFGFGLSFEIWILDLKNNWDLIRIIRTIRN